MNKNHKIRNSIYSYLSILFILMLLSVRVNGQRKTYPDIDQALMDNYNNTHDSGKFKEGIESTLKLINQCRKLNFQKGVVVGYIDIGNFLCTINYYSESLKYLEIAEKELTKIKDYSLATELYTEFGKVYHFIGLYDTSNQYYNKAIISNKKISNPIDRKNNSVYVYACKADNLKYLKESDSSKIYFEKAFKIEPDAITASNLALHYINNDPKKMDSAIYYLKLGNQLSQNYSPYQKSAVIQAWGDLYSKQKNYNEALKYYFESLEISKKIKSHIDIRDIYQTISKTYKSLNQEDKSVEYLKKYTILNDSLSSADKIALNFSVDKLIKEKEIEKEEIETKNHNILIIISLSAVIFLSLGYFLYKRNKKEKEKIIKIQQKEIIQKEIEKKNLEYKVNDSFDEVIQLAKTNSPYFLTRFKEVYPDFCEKLISLNPDLINSEFAFCAYLKLNFSTKEIANYTFVTEKAVQARKSRIRKKFNIPSDEDLYIWINKI
ncbi:Tetratricopeptide repeat-containing protein [Epilithonimonas hungarica]|uniref:Tetratricopeptide repeat-containing protein n=2 Tax=Epilithonimonas hungarica TaxID=454006 RepID=A0A1G7JGM3_9FLAO|nr:Tetratricopeptide repeat-containing protein [Epilithonimonas hungarica]